MNYELYFENYTNENLAKFEAVFNKITQKTLQVLKLKKQYEFSASIVDVAAIEKYNQQYRNQNGATDVISFAFGDHLDQIIYKNQPQMLGDILICFEVAKRQAIEYGHTLDRELAFLFAHGLLHLLGYDHMILEEEEKMFALQDEILQKLTIGKDFIAHE